MPAISVNQPYPIFTDADGQPLDDAYIYIGAANQNPVSNPITVYWDAALTIPASQPIRTSGGYPVYNGTPARFYVGSSYSILVKDKNGTFVYTAETKLGFFDVLVTDFGAIGDFNGFSGTDNTAAFQAALNFVSSQGGRVRVPGGLLNKYYFATQSGANPSLSIPSNVEIAIDNDVCLYTAGSVASGVEGYNVAGSSKKALFVNSNPTTGNVNISITGGKIKCVANSSIGQTHIAFKNVKKVLIRDVTLLDSWGACRAQFSYCQDVTIDAVQISFENAHAAPFSNEQGIRIGSGCSNFSITNSYIESGNEALVVTNTATETNTAITSIVKYPYAATGASISEIMFSNGALTTKNGAAISVTQSAGMTTGSINPLSFAYFTAKPAYPATSWGSAVFVKDYNSAAIPCAIGGISLTNFGIDGTQLGASGTGTPAVIDIASNVTGVVLLNGGIGTGGVGSVTNGIKIGAMATISDCDVSIFTDTGIIVDGTECRIVNSRISDCGNYGIRLTSNASDIVINSNKIDYAGVASIKADIALDVIVTNNNFQNSAAPIFPAGQPLNGVVISNNINPNNPACSVRSTNNQSISAATWTKVLFNQKDIDPNNNFDTSTSRWQPKVQGFYQITAGFNAASASIGLTGCQARVMGKNGPYVTGSKSSGFVSGVFYFNGTSDYAELEAYIDATTPVIFPGSAFTYFTSCKV